jgi:hypothetical protein
MTIQRSLLTTALIAAFGVGVPTFAADSHQHAAGEPSKLVLDHGKKWPTDEPLRKNMSEIRAALAAKAVAIHKGTLTPDDYKALGTLVQAHVANIVTECKLEPAADENLHLIVAELSAGADAMQGKAKVAPAAGAVQTVGAVNQYGRYFKHPGWKPMD